jgi:murein L,D-transpeptidase YafK
MPSALNSVLLSGAVAAALLSQPVQAAAPIRDTAVRRISLPPKMDPPGVPTPADRDRRLREKGLEEGAPMFIRVFKAEAELEVWLHKGERYELFATYPICYFSGRLGPKLREGDRQAPEGFYSVAHMHRHGRWPRSFDIGFPNALDRANKRTGSAILVHGGCSSIGCFAMTNALMEEIFTLADRAVDNGQASVPVHVFPFRMTDENMAAQREHPWSFFWANLKQAYDIFEREHLPPQVAVCGNRYLVREPDTDMAMPLTPRRMVKLARMMIGQRPIKAGECHEEPGPSLEAIAAAEKMATAVQTASIPQTPLARMPIPPVPVRAYRNVRANYAAARKARVAVFNRRVAARIR